MSRLKKGRIYRVWNTLIHTLYGVAIYAGREKPKGTDKSFRLAFRFLLVNDHLLDPRYGDKQLFNNSLFEYTEVQFEDLPLYMHLEPTPFLEEYFST